MTELLTIFFTSVVGSWHCAAMCGAFATMSAGKEKKYSNSIMYQLGRLISYLALTTLAYTVTRPVSWLVEKYELKMFAAIASIVMIGFWLFILVSKISFSYKPPQFIQTIFRKIRQTKGWVFSLLIGLSTALLPCVWLYGFIGLAATKSGYAESLGTILVFWAGTLPSLIFIQIFSVRLSQNFRKVLRPLAVVLLLIITSFSVYSRTQAEIKPEIEAGESCHHNH